ncbi:MAG: hypothetical protein K0U29_08550 [Gammaproteobacteria bacterium]|nr:hypothetical protein [Gammaproteobacteria bacterium]
MTLLTRGDGTPFVIQAYRESLVTHKRSILLQEIRLLAEQQGQYLRLFKNADQSIEAVFSKELGYLLAESIWHYFGKPDNLIYCEAVANSAQILLVVVQEASVYLDTRIMSNALRDELVPLMSGNQAYRIITYGEIPLRQADVLGGATFVFPKKLVDSFETLSAPIFDKLPKLDQYQLQPLTLALKSEYLRRRPTLPATVLVLLVLALAAWWLWAPNNTNKTAVQPIVQAKPANPYAQYDAVLQSVAPDVQLHDIVMKLQQLYLVPGWHISHMQMDGESYQVQMVPDGGDLELLSQWSKQHYFNFKITPTGPMLSVVNHLKPRNKPQRVFPLQSSVLRIMDRINLILRNNNSVEVGDSQWYGKTKETRLTITLSNISPELLDLVGQELKNTPTVLSHIDINVDSGFISGTIQLSVWGS